MPPKGRRSSPNKTITCCASGSPPGPSGPPIRSIRSSTRAIAAPATTGGRCNRCSRVEPPPVKDDKVGRSTRSTISSCTGWKQAGLHPSPPADRRTLIRRLSFDLIGLPPTPDEVATFVNDPDPAPTSGWSIGCSTRRTTASAGPGTGSTSSATARARASSATSCRESAWKYRDFVVEAFNSDLPYDEFVRWQIAGDVLRPDDPLAVIASGFLALGPYDLTAYNNGTPDMRAFAREEELEGLVAHGRPDVPGADRQLRPLPRPQVRSDHAEGVLSILRGARRHYQGDEREGVSDQSGRSGRRRDRIASLTARNRRALAQRKVGRRATRRPRSRREAFPAGERDSTAPKAARAHDAAEATGAVARPGAWRLPAAGRGRGSRGIAPLSRCIARLAASPKMRPRPSAARRWPVDCRPAAIPSRRA